jgi:uncharacterized Tic20 family protein
MSQVITNETFKDFVSKNEFQITFNINKNPNGLSIRIPQIKEDDIFYDGDDLEMNSPEPKKRRIEEPENDDNSKKRRSNVCPWFTRMILSFLVIMIMLPETLAISNVKDEYVIDRSCSEVLNFTVACIVAAVSGCIFCSALEEEERRGITLYSNFKIVVAVMIPMIVFVYWR